MCNAIVSRVFQGYHACISKEMLKNGKDKNISIRLSQSMLEALDARAILDEKDRTQVIREAIAEYLGLPEDSTEDRVNSLERTIDRLYDQVQRTEKRTDSFEKRLSELSRLMTICLERLT